jgi:hypothetical protein
LDCSLFILVFSSRPGSSAYSIQTQNNPTSSDRSETSTGQRFFGWQFVFVTYSSHHSNPSFSTSPKYGTTKTTTRREQWQLAFVCQQTESKVTFSNQIKIKIKIKI